MRAIIEFERPRGLRSRKRIHRSACRLIFPVLAAVLVLGMPGARPLLADTVQLLPTQDNTLYEPIAQDGFTDVSDGAGQTMFTGKVKDADADPGPGTRPAVRRAVLAFNIAGNIPVGATINSVQLTLYADKVKLTTSFNVDLHPLLADWGEGTSNTGNSQQGRGEPPTPGDATWHHTFYPDQFWTNPGGDYSLTISGTNPVLSALLAVLLLHEEMKLLMVAGMVMTVAGVLFTQLSKERNSDSAGERETPSSR